MLPCVAIRVGPQLKGRGLSGPSPHEQTNHRSAVRGLNVNWASSHLIEASTRQRRSRGTHRGPESFLYTESDGHRSARRSGNKARWEREVLEPALRSRRSGAGRSPPSRAGRSTGSTPPTTSRRIDYGRDIGDPGEFPYTRGIHPSGYRGKLWTMRQFAGFGTPEETNARYKELLAAGGTGLSVAFDLPTLMGRDPDHPLSLGEVGKCGVSITSLADMETALRRHPAGRHHDVDDDQLAGADDLRDVPGGGRAAGRRLEDASRAPSRTTS